jgi:hypothetical protein
VPEKRNKWIKLANNEQEKNRTSTSKRSAPEMSAFEDQHMVAVEGQRIKTSSTPSIKKTHFRSNTFYGFNPSELVSPGVAIPRPIAKTEALDRMMSLSVEPAQYELMTPSTTAGSFSSNS